MELFEGSIEWWNENEEIGMEKSAGLVVPVFVGSACEEQETTVPVRARG